MIRNGSFGLFSEKDLLDAEVFFQIQEMFGNAAGLTLTTFDSLSLQICPSSNLNPLCKKLLGGRSTHPEAAKRCVNEHFASLKKTLETGEQTHFRCWLGMENRVIPLQNNGKIIGAVLAGQVYSSSPSPALFEVLKKYGLDPESYYKMAQEMRLVSKEKYEEWLKLLITVIGSVIRERFQLLEERKNKKRLQFISELVPHIGDDLNKLLAFIVHSLPDVLEMESCVVFCRDEETGKFHPQASNFYSESKLEQFAVPLNSQNMNFPIDSEILVSSNPSLDGRLDQKRVKEWQIKSLLTIPLNIRNYCHGIIAFVNSKDPHLFTREEIGFISVLASEITLAIESTLLREEQNKNQKTILRFREEVQQYFSEIGKAIGSSLDLDKLLYLIADLSLKAARADSASLYLLKDQHLTRMVDIGQVPEEKFEKVIEDVIQEKYSLHVPLKIQEEPIGFLNLYSMEKHCFSKEVVDVIKSFGAQAALSIQNAHLFQAEQEKAEEISEVHEASKAISLHMDLTMILKETANQMCRISTASRCFILILDQERNVLNTSYVHGIDSDQSDFFSALAIPLNYLEGGLWVKFKAGEAVAIDVKGVEEELNPLKNLFSVFGTRNCLLVPLLSQGALIGLVYLDCKEVLHIYNQSDLRAALSLSVHAAASIEKARLYKQVEDQARQVQTLYHLSTLLSATLNLDKILNIIIEKTGQLVKTERLCLFMWDEDQKCFTVAASQGLSEEFIKKAVVKIEDRFVGLAAYRKKSVYSANILLETDNPQLARLFKKEGLGAVLAVPLLTKKITLGVITLFADLGYQFKEKEIHLLGNFASHAALCIENARLYQANKQKLQELGVIFDVGKRVSIHLNPQDVLRSMTEQFLWVMKTDGCSIMLLNPDEKTLSIQVTRGITRKSNLQKKISIKEGFLGKVARSGQPIVFHDNGKTEGDMAFPEALRAEGITTILSVPLATKEKLFGVVSLYSKERKEYNPSEIHLITTLAGQASVAYQNAKTFEEHYHVAQLIQRSLLPDRVPSFKEVEIGFQYLPSQEISGDYYDFLDFGGKLGIVVADVSGKGTSAAIFTSQGKYAWKAYALLESDPQKVLTLLNRVMIENVPADKFISLIYAVMDLKKMEMTYSNAGHLPPLLYRSKTKELQYLEAPGMLLGIDDKAEFSKRKVSLMSGDFLLFYTDGVTEAQNEKGEFFAIEKLQKAFISNINHSPQVIANRILATVRQWTHKRRLDDDITILVLSVK
jgi:GAF domain-containing protein/ligand-binding sensor protein